MDILRRRLRKWLIAAFSIVVAGIVLIIVKDIRYRDHTLNSSITYSLPNVTESTRCEHTSQSIELFTIELIPKLDYEQNQCISPLSLYELMSMIYFGATGMTKQQIARVLQKPEKDSIFGQDLYVLNNKLKQTAGDSFHGANAVWMNDGLKLEKDIDANFLALIANYMQSEVYFEDFNKVDITKKMDRWADKNSDGYIKELNIQPDPMDQLYFLNTVCFEDQWKYKFKKEQRKQIPFYGTKGESQIMMMSQEHRDFMCIDNDQMIGIQMPYEGNYVMEVYMSKDEDQTIQDICSQMSLSDGMEFLNEFKQHGVKKDVKPYVPKLNFDYELNAIPLLQNLGITDAFDQRAEFDNIAKDQDIFISKAGQRTYLEVDEEGTKAFSISFADGKGNSVENYDDFIVNRPFIFMIRNTDTETILFYGSITNL